MESVKDFLDKSLPAYTSTFSSGPVILGMGFPEKRGNALNVYYVYPIQVKMGEFQTTESTVWRRSKEFASLYKELLDLFKGSIVPPIPELATFVDLAVVDRTAPEYLEKRRRCYEWFIKKVALHPVLGRSTAMLRFLDPKVTDYSDLNANDTQNALSTMEKTQRRLEKFGKETSKFSKDAARSMMKSSMSLAKPNSSSSSAVSKDPYAKEMESLQATVMELEHHINKSAKISDKTVRARFDLAEQCLDAGNCFNAVSKVDKNISEGVKAYARGLHQAAHAMREQTMKESVQVVEPLQILVESFAGPKVLFKNRENALSAYEQAVDSLDEIITDRAKASLETSSAASATGGSSSLQSNHSMSSSIAFPFPAANTSAPKVALSNLLTKMRLTQRLEDKIGKLDSSLTESQEHMDRERRAFEEISDSVVAELDRFNRERHLEILKIMRESTNLNIEYLRKLLSTWESVAGTLNDAVIKSVSIQDIQGMTGRNRQSEDGPTYASDLGIPVETDSLIL